MAKVYSSDAPQPQKYVTLRGEGRAEYEEKKSLFIATAAHTETETAALEFIAKIKTEFPDATHNVYAYYIKGGAVARYSDDGEPQGTSGPPVYNVLKMSGSDDLSVVVTRYFGGILLGAGGLVRAYSAAARLGVEAAGIAEYVEFKEYTLSFSYADYSRAEYEFVKSGAKLGVASFSDNVNLKLAVKATDADALMNKLRELTNARVKIFETGTRFDCD